ncbi:hypothetical protein DMENIID0001_009730 [Sergentomyia squamirostris]
MKKKVLNYIHFTKSELDGYTRDKTSCVECVNNSMHISFPPWGMDDFKETLLNAVAVKKIGLFDAELNGIVLDVRNIKLNGEMSFVRYDTPELHLTIRADFYVFRPQVGAIFRGVVKFNSQKHISVLIYRVFNVSIRLPHANKKQKLQLGTEITFRVKKFDLQNILPYIEGELVDTDSLDSGISTSEEKTQPDIKVRTSSTESSASDSEEESEKEYKPSVRKNDVPEGKRRVSSSSEDSEEENNQSAKKKKVSFSPLASEASDSDSESEKEFKAAVGPIRIPEVKKNDSTDEDTSESDSDSDSRVNNTESQKTVVIKKEPFKSPSPEKHPKVTKQSTKVSIKHESKDNEDEDDDFEMELPINRQIGELINRYSQSEDTDASLSSSSRNKSKNNSSPVKFSPKHALKKTPSASPTKKRSPTPSSSSSDEDEEDFDVCLDVNTSISALLAKVKQEKSTPPAVKTPAKPVKKKLHNDTASQSFGSPQLSSTKLLDNKSKGKKKSQNKTK